MEKLGGADPCPCGSGRRFPQVLSSRRTVRRRLG
ncbi:SEC-C metal-binding domain-containing protein [Catenulispora sp. GP43]